jgi:DNA-binding GntR family transcriptional regulator
LRSVPITRRPRAGGSPRAKKVAPPDITCALRERIATHEIPPGSKLRENESALEFG